MELIFLGTSAGVPTRTRNVTAILLNLQHPTQSGLWLFDCGEGTQHQLLHTAFNPGKLDKIFISHLHGDHLFGLPGLLCSRSMSGIIQPLTGNDSNLLIVFYVQIMPDDFVMQLHRF